MIGGGGDGKAYFGCVGSGGFEKSMRSRGGRNI